jgi:hypothetical protein
MWKKKAKKKAKVNLKANVNLFYITTYSIYNVQQKAEVNLNSNKDDKILPKIFQHIVTIIYINNNHNINNSDDLY